MIFKELELSGVYVIELERREDERGWFARGFCEREFGEHGLLAHVAQANLAYSRDAGTVRGMHFQVPPNAEAKLVRCTAGAIHDVVVDLRPESPTYLAHVAVELAAGDHRALYIPERFAHGYQVLMADTEISYQATAAYSPSDERALRYDDPKLAIDWPLPVTSVSEKDRLAPDLAESAGGLESELRIP